jgi:hypothetical protein
MESLRQEAKRGNNRACSTMGWEKRGSHQYYYRKEREGSRVRSVYVGRGEIANMISQFQSDSSLIEKVARQTKAANDVSLDNAVLVFEQAIQLLTQAALLAPGFIRIIDNGGANAMLTAIEGPITAKAEPIRAKFQALLDKTNKEQPQQ